MSTQAVASLQAAVNRLKHELATMRVSDQIPGAGESVTIADYLLERLVQLNVTVRTIQTDPCQSAYLTMYSRPCSVSQEISISDSWITSKIIPRSSGRATGRYCSCLSRSGASAELLFLIFPHSNELNASYAADGYARVKEGGIGVLLTTFGVGELSATNGIAGAFSEHVPVLHLVGVPSTTQQKTKPMLHHTLGDGRFDAYHVAAQQFAISHGSLQDVNTAPAEIDRILTDCVVLGRPAYLMLPTDLVHQQVSRKRLLTPLNVEPPQNDQEIEAHVLNEITKLLEEADNDAVILLDACTIRHGVRKEAKAFIEKTGLPVYAAPMGKSAISETYERYGGVSGA